MTDYVDLLNAAEEQKQSILMVYRQYQEALAENQIVVFVRDNEAKRLVSFSLPCE